MPSLISHVTSFLIRMSGSKRTFADPDAVRRQAAEAAIRPKSFVPPRTRAGEVDIHLFYPSGWPTYHVTPKSGVATRHGVYVHGGAWVHEIAKQQWDLVLELVARAQVSITVPIYPLAPRGTASKVVPRIAELLAGLVSEHGAAQTFAMGDSAGGQIVLSSVVLLRDQGLPALADTILISPALDLTLGNPAIDEVEPRDPWLARAGIRAAVEMWRAERPIGDPLVSPLRADLRGLGPLTIFSGTRNITNPDTKLLAEKLRAARVKVDYHEEKDLIHVYPILYGPEARRARSHIVQLLDRR